VWRLQGSLEIPSSKFRTEKLFTAQTNENTNRMGTGQPGAGMVYRKELRERKELAAKDRLTCFDVLLSGIFSRCPFPW
jgi:hypothetical protein